MTEKYTKDKLIEEFIRISGKNIEAFNGVQDALNKINDQNILHSNKEDGRNETVKRLVDGNEKFYKLFSYVLILLIAALILLAGAEKVLKIIPFVQ